MGQVWTFEGAPATTVGAPTGLITLLDGTTFCISESSGDIRHGGAQGLFVRDTRLISRLELSINGHVPEPLAPQAREPYACTFLSRMPPLPGLADSTMLVARRRVLNDGLSEEITLRNMSTEPLPVTLRIGIGGDFADVFEVKEGRVHADAAGADGMTVAVDNDSIMLSREVANSLRGARITGERQPDAELEVSASQLTWHAVVPAHGAWSTTLQITPSLNGKNLIEYRAQASPNGDRPTAADGPQQRLADWRQQSPLVRASDPRLATVFAASTEDLGSLRIFDPEHADRMVIAAGAPWFMTIFGRDSLLTSWMMLPLDPSLALGTMRTLASMQGTKVTPATEEEPGKILHEMRFGMQASLWLGGSSVYYGTVDATPLFVMLLGELRRWGLEREIVDELLPHADRALDWIVNYGDRDGDGFVEYGRSTELGLANQGWKDSFDGITFADGTMAEPPIALAEVQGYAYAAFLAKSHFCREREDTDGAERWAQRAQDLKERFNEAFWMPEKGYFALGLDGRQAADRLARLEHGSLPVDRHRRRGQGGIGRQGADRPRDVLRVRDQDAGQFQRRVQPDELPQRFHLAARQRDLRGRPDALRLRPGSAAGVRWQSSRRPRRSAAGCPSCSAASTARSLPSRSATRPRARRRPGRQPPHFTCSAPCCGSTPRRRPASCGATRPSRRSSCRCGSSRCTWREPGCRSTSGRTAGRSTASARC